MAKGTAPPQAPEAGTEIDDRRRKPRARESKATRTSARQAAAKADAGQSVARAEASLYASVLKIKEENELEQLGIAFYDAETSLQWSYNADHWFHAASTMKMAVLLGVFRQVARNELALEEPVHVRNKFASIVDRKPFTLDLGRDADSEVYRFLGRTMSVKQLAYQMITTSSNFATNLLVDVVGVDVIQQALDDLHIDGVRVLRGVEDQAAFEAGLNNEVTANGLLKLLRLIAEGAAFTPECSEQMLNILLDQRYKSGIPAGLPGAARVAHKTGNIMTVHHDAGIVFLENREPYVLVVLTQFAAEATRGTAVAEVSRDIYTTLAEIATR
jgi:beta-lactamase class A